MGHYASEMQDESDEILALRKKFNGRLRKLESLPASAFTVAELHEVFLFVSGRKAPPSQVRSFEEKRTILCMNEYLAEMKVLIKKAKKAQVQSGS